jgi:hypothetical protein
MENKQVENNLKIIISAVRFAGVLIFAFGILLLFNIGGLAEGLNLQENEMNKLIGMFLSILGIVEFILTPRILESILLKNKK